MNERLYSVYRYSELCTESLTPLFSGPQRTDTSLFAQFFFADDELNKVTLELDSFDGRKDPERCTLLVNQLRACQDKVGGRLRACRDQVGRRGLRACRRRGYTQLSVSVSVLQWGESGSGQGALGAVGTD